MRATRPTIIELRGSQLGLDIRRGGTRSARSSSRGRAAPTPEPARKPRTTLLSRPRSGERSAAATTSVSRPCSANARSVKTGPNRRGRRPSSATASAGARSTVGSEVPSSQPIVVQHCPAGRRRSPPLSMVDTFRRSEIPLPGWPTDGERSGDNGRSRAGAYWRRQGADIGGLTAPAARYCDESASRGDYAAGSQRLGSNSDAGTATGSFSETTTLREKRGGCVSAVQVHGDYLSNIGTSGSEPGSGAGDAVSFSTGTSYSHVPRPAPPAASRLGRKGVTFSDTLSVETALTGGATVGHERAPLSGSTVEPASSASGGVRPGAVSDELIGELLSRGAALRQRMARLIARDAGAPADESPPDSEVEARLRDMGVPWTGADTAAVFGSTHGRPDKQSAETLREARRVRSSLTLPSDSSGTRSSVPAGPTVDGGSPGRRPPPPHGRRTTLVTRRTSKAVNIASRMPLLQRVTFLRVCLDHVSLDSVFVQSVSSAPSGAETRVYVEYHLPVEPAGQGRRTTRLGGRKLATEVPLGHRAVVAVSLAAAASVRLWQAAELQLTLIGRAAGRSWPLAVAALPLRQLLRSPRLAVSRRLPLTLRAPGRPLVGHVRLRLQLGSDRSDFQAVLSERSRPAGVAGVVRRRASLDRGAAGDARPALSDSGAGLSTDGEGSEAEGTSDGETVEESAEKENVAEGGDRPLYRTECEVRSVRHVLTDTCLAGGGEGAAGERAAPLTERSSSSAATTARTATEKPRLVYWALSITCGRPGRPGALRNSYLVVRAPWLQQAASSVTCWAQEQPQYDYTLMCPVLLTPSLLGRLHNNLLVVEVWQRAHAVGRDRLLGLCRVPLERLYITFSQPEIMDTVGKLRSPVMAYEGGVSVVHPGSGETAGRLQLSLAAGTQHQVETWLAPPSTHSAAARSSATSEEEGSAGCTCSVTVTLGRLLHVPDINEARSGELDCFVQYTWPVQNECAAASAGAAGGAGALRLQSFCTEPVISRVNPHLQHVTTHHYWARAGSALAEAFVAACASDGGARCEVVARTFYPSVVDKVVARGVLSSSQIFGLIEACSSDGRQTRTFAVPLSLLESGDDPAHPALEMTVSVDTAPSNAASRSDVNSDTVVMKPANRRPVSPDVIGRTTNQAAASAPGPFRAQPAGPFREPLLREPVREEPITRRHTWVCGSSSGELASSKTDKVTQSELRTTEEGSQTELSHRQRVHSKQTDPLTVRTDAQQGRTGVGATDTDSQTPPESQFSYSEPAALPTLVDVSSDSATSSGEMDAEEGAKATDKSSQELVAPVRPAADVNSGDSADSLPASEAEMLRRLHKPLGNRLLRGSLTGLSSCASTDGVNLLSRDAAAAADRARVLDTIEQDLNRLRETGSIFGLRSADEGLIDTTDAPVPTAPKSFEASGGADLTDASVTTAQVISASSPTKAQLSPRRIRRVVSPRRPPLPVGQVRSPAGTRATPAGQSRPLELTHATPAGQPRPLELTHATPAGQSRPLEMTHAPPVVGSEAEQRAEAAMARLSGPAGDYRAADHRQGSLTNAEAAVPGGERGEQLRSETDGSAMSTQRNTAQLAPNGAGHTGPFQFSSSVHPSRQYLSQETESDQTTSLLQPNGSETFRVHSAPYGDPSSKPVHQGAETHRTPTADQRSACPPRPCSVECSAQANSTPSACDPPPASAEAGTFRAQLTVSEALHLPRIVRGRRRQVPRVSVSVQTARCTAHSPLVSGTRPQWDWTQLLQLDSDLLMQDLPCLVLKVWHHPETAAAAAGGAPARHRLLGLVPVDLAPLLHGLDELLGWYNIVDLAGLCRGQMKLSLRPLEALPCLDGSAESAGGDLCDLSTSTDDLTTCQRPRPVPGPAAGSGSGPGPAYVAWSQHRRFPSHLSRFTEVQIRAAAPASASAAAFGPLAPLQCETPLELSPRMDAPPGDSTRNVSLLPPRTDGSGVSAPLSPDSLQCTLPSEQECELMEGTRSFLASVLKRNLEDLDSLKSAMLRRIDAEDGDVVSDVQEFVGSVYGAGDRPSASSAPLRSDAGVSQPQTRMEADRRATGDRRMEADRRATDDRRMEADRRATGDRRMEADRSATDDRRMEADRSVTGDRREWDRGRQPSSHPYPALASSVSAHGVNDSRMVVRQGVDVAGTRVVPVYRDTATSPPPVGAEGMQRFAGQPPGGRSLGHAVAVCGAVVSTGGVVRSGVRPGAVVTSGRRPLVCSRDGAVQCGPGGVPRTEGADSWRDSTPDGSERAAAAAAAESARSELPASVVDLIETAVRRSVETLPGGAVTQSESADSLPFADSLGSLQASSASDLRPPPAAAAEAGALAAAVSHGQLFASILQEMEAGAATEPVAGGGCGDGGPGLTSILARDLGRLSQVVSASAGNSGPQSLSSGHSYVTAADDLDWRPGAAASPAPPISAERRDSGAAWTPEDSGDGRRSARRHRLAAALDMR